MSVLKKVLEVSAHNELDSFDQDGTVEQNSHARIFLCTRTSEHCLIVHGFDGLFL